MLNFFPNCDWLLFSILARIGFMSNLNFLTNISELKCDNIFRV